MKHTLVLPSDHLLLALSGGADSVALLLMLLEQGVHPVAAHCNFHLRGEESQRDEDFVRQLCHERGVELHVQHFDTQRECQLTGESIEMAARRLRYAWFEELRQQQGLDYICTAHHKDDQAETLLLNLVRGAGLAGLRGMQPIQGRICRPLLDLYTRDELQAYLNQHSQTWVEDSSNSDTHYQRNLVRHELLPILARLNPQAINHITETTHHLRKAEQLLVSTQENWEEEHCIILPDGLRIPFSSDTKVGAELCAEGPLMATRSASGIEVRLRPQRVPPTPITPHPTQSREHLRDKRYALVDATRATPPFTLRSLEPGDRFQPYGMQGTRLVSDYLTDRHRSRIDKLAQLVVCDKEGIIWLCGETISQRVALTAQTTEILEFRPEDLVVS